MIPDQTIENSLKPVYLEIVNFKNISKKIVDIGGRSFLVMGPNEGGKSSLIQAITGPLDRRTLPSINVKDGEDAGRITLKLAGKMHGKDEEYTIDCFFSQKDQAGRIKLSDAVGAEVKSPATKIKDIIGTVSFDIMEFYRAKKDEKLKIIKRLTGKGVEIDKCNMEIKNLKAQKTAKNGRAEELEGVLKNHQYSQEDINKYSTPIPLEPIQQEYARIEKDQQTWDGVNNHLNKLYTDVNAKQQEINNGYAEKTRIDAEIKRLQDRMVEIDKAIVEQQNFITTTQGRINQGETWKNDNPRPTMDAVNQKLVDAGAHNQHYQRIGQLSNQQNEMLTLKQEIINIEAAVEKKEAERDNIISNSQLPIPGMRFTEEELYINNLPLEEGQQNTQALMDIAVDVAIAMNPNLKVIFLNEANLFDKVHLQAVIKKIESKGYMVIAEFVKWEGGSDVEVIFTEQIFK